MRDNLINILGNSKGELVAQLFERKDAYQIKSPPKRLAIVESERGYPYSLEIDGISSSFGTASDIVPSRYSHVLDKDAWREFLSRQKTDKRDKQ